MFTNVNLSAPVGALGFLGAAFVIFLLSLVLAYSLIKRKVKVSKFSLAAIVVVSVCYVGLLLVFSLSSKEQALAKGQEKHFCELDCHLAYSIADEQEVKTLGNAPDQITAQGNFRVITIKTRFDENTISPTRGNGPLYPNSRVVSVIDENGRQYSPSAEGQRILKKSQAAGAPLTTPLRPGESYTTTLAFDLPSNVRTPTLLIREGEWLTHFVIGHENSFLHKKIRFQI